MAGLGGCAKAFAQLVRSGTGFTTFPYAGQECVDLHALKSMLATATIANTLKTFFIVSQMLDLHSKISLYYLDLG